ncbi:flagellar basal body-associated FliL family protein [Parasulfitobacter algicola]|uniref:Flagellar protein FliL n=1 Tax=Parasulfitobacter algicola TaxID=2614809 RepID=A0ABX2IP39_9RHOB|nr:flagellar basal body-associated FliL family protein [Sulfitobacter algicola]NSX54661.1 flagellar basal body-associated FliL family protein [Sulfitobacter algicola]
MAEIEENSEPKKKKSKLPFLLGVILAFLGAGGGFFAVQSGMILGSGSHSAHAEEKKSDALPKVAFVAMDPLHISLGRGAERSHLRFQAQLEVEAGAEEDVQVLLPRVADVLNSYLRAVELSEVEDPSALVRLRAQMLRRVQLVVGDEHVKDLLIIEFILT